jgi:hypothetical protein
VCGRLFKKVYCTRDYARNLAQNIVEGQDMQLMMMSSVFENEIRSWKCALCNKQKMDG